MPPVPEARPHWPPQPEPGPVVIEGGRQITVTRESEHQDALAGVEGPVVVELDLCTIDVGRYRGRRGIEVQLAGRRVGELTYTMSQRYTALVEMLLEQGQAPTCRAIVTREQGAAGDARVVLLLPEPDELMPPVVEPPTELLATQQVQLLADEPGDAATSLIPDQRTALVGGVAGDLPTSFDSPFAGYPAGGSSRGWKWIVAGAAAAVIAVVSVIVIGFGGDDEAPIAVATPPAEPTAGATDTQAATPTSAGQAATSARTTARRTTAAPPPVTPTLVTRTTPVPTSTSATPTTSSTRPRLTTSTRATTPRQTTTPQGQGAPA